MQSTTLDTPVGPITITTFSDDDFQALMNEPDDMRQAS